ncbi:MAG: hypothetical protein AABX93_00710 [Nanoarchaeota archaeon]
MSHGSGTMEVHTSHGGQKRLIVFSIFIGILAFLIVTSFYDEISLTGSFISNINPNSTTKFYAELTSPSLDIKGNFEKIELKGSSDSFFYVGDQKFLLNSKNNYIVLNNYSGEMAFDSESISVLSGKATSVVVNGIVIEPNEKDSIKVSFDKNFDYSFLNIEKNILLEKIFYTSSGTIKINGGKNIFNIEEESINVKNFVGNLKVENNKFKLNGSIESMEIQGQNQISVSK